MTLRVGKDGLINVFQFVVLKSSYRLKKRNMN